jgi:hypothetical protein
MTDLNPGTSWKNSYLFVFFILAAAYILIHGWKTGDYLELPHLLDWSEAHPLEP